MVLGNFPPDVTLPVVVWRNVAEDLRAMADAVEAQIASFEQSLDEESFLTLRFPAPALHTALELIARAQMGDEAFEELMAGVYGDEEDDGAG
jgi:2'-5' RNA ligase